MVISGYLEAINEFQARGWAFDADDPGGYVELEFVLNGELIGSIAADLFRQDLVTVGLGGGDHGFVFNFPTPLDAGDLDEVRVRVRTRGPDGSRIELERLAPAAESRAAAAEPEPAGAAALLRGHDQRCHAVSGVRGLRLDARSGTSAMAQALLKIDRYRGYNEGHILDLLAHLSERLRTFYNLKYDDTLPGRNTMIEQVPIEFLQDTFNHIFIDMIRRLLGEGYWVDKTPNSDSIYLAPRFLELWPNARFIFMRRRALENLASRSRKFPEYNFAKNCQEWKDAMQAWLSVRDQLHGAAIEVDQMYLSHHPQEVADQLRSFLGLSDVETRVVTQAFAHDRPQRTAATVDDVMELAAMGWNDGWMAEFERVCRPVMDAYGYTADASYHRDGIDGGGLVVL